MSATNSMLSSWPQQRIFCLTMHCSLQIGFRSVEVVTDKLVGAVTGFDRPIEVYHKVMGAGSSS